MTPQHEYLRRLLQDAHVVELRHANAGRWTSGLFDDPDALSAVIRGLTGNLYTSLNRPRSDVLARNTMGTSALKDQDIGTITRIPFDLDPMRPPDTPSTDAELAAAIEARTILVRTLASFGWPAPAIGISGNGAHFLYRTCLSIETEAARTEWRRASSAIYAGLRNLLRDPLEVLGVLFDTSVRNPARIWRLYGSINGKGTATAERPYREAVITLPVGPWQTVTAEVINRTAEALAPRVLHEQREARRHAGPITGKGDFSTLDIRAWFVSHGAYRREIADGKHAVACPWIGEHSTTSEAGTDTVIWEHSTTGWPTFFCAHGHCQGRTLRDVIALWGDADQFCAREWKGGRHG